VVRILLISAGVVAGVVSSFLVKRGIGYFSPPPAPAWPTVSDLSLPRVRLKKQRRQHPDGKEIDNGAVHTPESV
jgi:uncharacterized membrane protein YagU involved in acid resistance